MRGRRPKPTRLKILTGNPGKRPLNSNEPHPEVALPDCPPELGPVARQEWERMTAQLAPLRILTHLDRAALASYCAAYALWAEATQAIQTYGAMVKSPSGYPVQSPYVSIANRQTEIMMRIASEFGFTPASRSRISAPPPLNRLFLTECRFQGQPIPSELRSSDTRPRLLAAQQHHDSELLNLRFLRLNAMLFDGGRPTSG